MANENTSSSVLAGTRASRLPATEPAGGLVDMRSVDNRSLTVVVVNMPVVAGPARTPALRPARPVRPLLPALPYSVPRQFGRRIAVPSAVLLLAGIAASWWMLPRGGRDEPADVIRIQLPPPRMEMTAQSALGTPDVLGSPMVAQGKPAPVARAREHSAPAQPAAHGGAGGSLAEIGDLPEVAAATAMALRSGVAQNWQAKGLSGVAVAGPVQLEGNNVCRTVAVLADGGAGGQTVRSLRCMTRAGRWVRPASVPAPDAPAITDAAGPGGGQANAAADGIVR